MSSATCLSCKKPEKDEGQLIFCDSCSRPLHKKECSGLCSSEIRVMELRGSRMLKFYCMDCKKGFTHVPALIKMVEDLRVEVSELRKLISTQNPVAAPTNPDPQIILNEVRDRQERSNNIMLFNVPESDDDETAVISTLNIVLDTPPVIVSSTRVGRKNKNNARAIKVTLQSAWVVQQAIRNRGKLKGHRIYVGHDLTQTQREAEKRVLSELRERTASGESNLRLSYRGDVPSIVQKN